jgi:hypothetical protein
MTKFALEVIRTINPFAVLFNNSFHFKLLTWIP